MILSGIQKFTTLDYPGEVACIAFTPGCNFRCGYCHNPEFVLPEEIAKIKDSFIQEETFFKFLETRKNLLDAVVVSGGEPTIMSDLAEFIKKIKAMNFKVKLDTNGNKPEVINELLAQNLIDYIAMDIKISTADYCGLVGKGADHKKITQSINCIINSSIEYEFRSTLIKQVHATEKLKQMAKEIAGAKRLYLQHFRPGVTLKSQFTSYTPFSNSEMEEIKNLFKESVEEVLVR